MRHVLKQLSRSQRGFSTLSMALIGLMFSTLLVIPFLANVQTHLISAQKNSSPCSAATGIEYAIWVLNYGDPTITDPLTVDDPSLTVDSTICSETVAVTITKAYPEGYTEPVYANVPPKSVSMSKTVTPDSVNPGGVDTTFTYTISTENLGKVLWHMERMSDLLPLYLSYVPGSSSGMTTDDPVITTNGNQEYIYWDFSPVEKFTPGEIRTQTFQASGTLYQGTHFNEASGLFNSGVRCRGTGPVAPITITNGPTPPAPPAATARSIEISKTVTPQFALANSETVFTYTVTVDNTGTETLNVKRIYDITPAFLTYQLGTTTGDITDNPSINKSNDNEELRWTIPSEDKAIDPGETWVFSFQTKGALPEGIYYNIAWLALDEDPPKCVPTGDEAPIEFSGHFDISVTYGGETINVRIARNLAQSTLNIGSWQVE